MPTPTRALRARDPLFEIIGWLALLLSVAMLSPGVIATRASGEPVSSAAEGQSCSAGKASAESAAVGLEQHIESLRTQLAVQQQAEGQSADSDFVALDNSGFNYRPTPAQSPPPADR